MYYTCSKLHVNLLSMNKLVSNYLKIQFNLYKFIVEFCVGEAIAIVPFKHNLDKINFVKVHEVEDGTLELWHRLFGHLNVKGMHTFHNMISGVNLGKFSYSTMSLLCEVCIKDKQYKVEFPNKGGGKRPSLWKLCIPTCAVV